MQFYILWQEITFCEKMARGLQKSQKMYRFPLVLMALAHPGRAGRKSAQSCENRAKYFAFFVKMLIFMQKVGDSQKIIILRSPKTLVFLVKFNQINLVPPQ